MVIVYVIVPVLDFITAVVNLATNLDTSGWYIAVYGTQFSLSLLGGLLWIAALLQLGNGNNSDMIIAIWSLFHMIGEAVVIALTTWADYFDPKANVGNAQVTYVLAGFNIFIDLLVIILELAD